MSVDDELNDIDERPSKSQRKRDMTALQQLGEQLAALPVNTLKKMPLDEQLLDALLQVQKISQREARRRQLQRVGKLMRDVEDIDAVRSAYDATQAGSVVASRTLHLLEHWRTRLLADGDAAIGEALQFFPALEAAQLRQLLRDAKREAEQQKPPAAARKLFKYLKACHGIDPDA